MRLTLALYGVSYRRLRKEVWKRRGYVRSTPLTLPHYLQGINILDPNAPPPPVPDPVEDSLPDTRQYHPKPSINNHRDYHKDEFVYEYNLKTRLMEHLQQASILSKTHVKYGLPKKVEDCVGLLQIPEQDMLVQRYIMQANIWDPTKEKLPRRINTRLPGWRFKAEWGIPENKIRSILLQNLLRLCQMIGGQYDDLLMSRALVQTPYLSVSYLNGTRPILLRGTQECMMTSERPLEDFADTAEVQETATFDLPDLQPLLPTISLVKQKIFREGENITGYKSDFSHNNPHTLFMGAWKTLPTNELRSKMLMYCFGHCLATAKARYGLDVKTLPEPISMQCVLTNAAKFHFACFQLNTVDFTSTDGIKNLVWFDDDENEMYKKILPQRAMLRNTKYEDYNPEVFRKILRLYAYGADLMRETKKANIQT